MIRGFLRGREWTPGLALMLLLAALGATLYIRSQLVAEQDSVITGTRLRFELTGVLGRPESRSMNFRELENLVKATENRLLEKVYVSKLTEKGEELTVHPFHVDLTNPDWRDLDRWMRIPIGANQTEGFLYIRVNRDTIHLVNGVIIVLALLLSGGLGLFLFRLKGQDRRIDQLSGELESRRAQVIRLERLALAGQLSASMLHDIKKPVLNIKHEVADALDGFGDDPNTIFRAIAEQTDLYLQLLRDVGMESFVNASGDETEWCDLVDIIDRSIRLVQYEKGSIQTAFKTEGHHTFLIKATPHKLIQLFSNLVLNAYQAMEHNGDVRLSLSRNETVYTVIMEDSGPGIPGEIRDSLFKPFYTTREEKGGSGLGLYICKQLVSELDGSITIGDSRDLGGALFRVSFPVEEE